MGRIRTQLQSYAAAQQERRCSRSSIRALNRAIANAVTPESRHELVVLAGTRD